MTTCSPALTGSDGSYSVNSSWPVRVRTADRAERAGGFEAGADDGARVVGQPHGRDARAHPHQHADEAVGIDDELADLEARVAAGADVDGALGAGRVADGDDAGGHQLERAGGREQPELGERGGLPLGLGVGGQLALQARRSRWPARRPAASACPRRRWSRTRCAPDARRRQRPARPARRRCRRPGAGRRRPCRIRRRS